MFGLTTTRRLKREVALAHALTEAAYTQRDKARKRADTAHFNRQQVLAQNAGLHADNQRLQNRVPELGNRISRLTESDPEYAAGLERRLARALRACAGYRTELAAETRRADRLQAQLDDAVGLTPRGVKGSAPFQPGYQKPKKEAAS